MEEYNFEMPTSCQNCGEIFDLNEGRGSEKWYPDTVICESCWEKEQKEIEEDERWEQINIDVSNALYELKEEGTWVKLTKENRALIIQIISNSLLSSENIKKWHAILTGKGEQAMYNDINKTELLDYK